jgi:multidrug resistance efflux pump
VLLDRQSAVENRVETFRQQLRMAELSRPQALTASEARLEMGKQRQKAAVQTLDAARAAKQTASLNLSRQQQLQQKGLASRRTLELAELEMNQRDAESERAQASLNAAKSEVDALNADWLKLSADTTASVEKTRAELNKAIEDQNYVRADLLKLETRLARQQTQAIKAPRDGTLLRLLANPNAEQLKAGQALAILVPDTEQRAVELWVDGNDLPLIVTGSHVRLQFEGYPSVQFGGWPEFSVGSFGGQVSLIDATDDGKGHFRILVSPDPSDIAWPDVRFLRQGVRVNGWILLGRVSLGYEMWRIFNGFPALVLPEPQIKESSSVEGKKTDSEDKK